MDWPIHTVALWVWDEEESENSWEGAGGSDVRDTVFIVAWENKAVVYMCYCINAIMYMLLYMLLYKYVFEVFKNIFL